MNRNQLRKVIVTNKNDKTYQGYFHSWGQEAGSFDRTMGNPGTLITIAIIEKEDGKITTELPSSIKFDDDLENKIMAKFPSRDSYSLPPTI